MATKTTTTQEALADRARFVERSEASRQYGYCQFRAVETRANGVEVCLDADGITVLIHGRGHRWIFTPCAAERFGGRIPSFAVVDDLSAERIDWAVEMEKTAVAEHQQLRNVLAAIPAELGRGEYEQHCRQHSVELLADIDCSAGGEFWPPEYPFRAALAAQIAQRRSRGIQRERDNRRPAEQITGSEMVQCDCGCSVERGLVMVASLGTACPDCYDRLSDADS